MLRQVCDDLGLECFGYLPKSSALEQNSRYLGLDFSKTVNSQDLNHLLEEHINWRQLLSFTKSLHPCGGKRAELRRRLVVARNQESFSFIYQENIDRFGNVTFFNPETEVPNLDDAGLLYLPGGYPEKHLEALVANKACRKAIKDYAERGGRIQAECGGMMYLCEKIVTDNGEYPMCGVLPYSITARQCNLKLSLGYRKFVIDGKDYRGHEFHYTQFLGETPKSIVQVYNAKGEPVDTPVLKYRNVLASYTHLYEIIG